MANFKDILKLTEGDGGKVFVVDEKGDLKAVVLGAQEYERLAFGKLTTITKDIEAINREITLAQLESETVVPNLPIASLPVQRHEGNGRRVPVDLRSEVIDPNFNFNAPPGEEYEAITPDFEDI